MRKIGEAHHHQPLEVRQYMAQALDIVNELELDDDLKRIAFAKALDLLSAKQLQYEQVIPGPPILGLNQR